MSAPTLPPSLAGRLLLWRELCAWLEDRPYNACYPWDYGGSSHPLARSGGRFSSLIERSTAAAAERRRTNLIHWQSGLGWRLRKRYRERLAELAAEVPEAELVLAILQADAWGRGEGGR